MEDEIWKRNEPDSPCVRVCVIHPEAKLCMGCFRTTDEIASWRQMSPEARRALMAELPTREADMKPKRRRGARRARSAE